MRPNMILYLLIAFFITSPFLSAFEITGVYPYSNGAYPYSAANASLFTNSATGYTNYSSPGTVRLTTSANPAAGGGALPSSGNYTRGSRVQLSVLSSSGYAFRNWSCTGTGCYSGNSPTATVVMNNSMTETANFQSTKTRPYQLITIPTPYVGGTISPPIGTFLAGTTVNISASPTLNYGFVNWTCAGTGCYSGNAIAASITMNGNITETANFKALNNTYYLNVEANPPAGGNVMGKGNYVAGTKVRVSASPARGYIFTGWSCSGLSCYSGMSPSQTVTVSTNLTEIANFQKNQTLYKFTTVSSNQSEGSVLNGGVYPVGTTVLLSEAAALGDVFVNWTCTGTGCYSGTNPYAAITLLGNVTETANFKK